MPENREVVVFAYYTSYPKGPLPVGMLHKMADESETLRSKGLSQLGTHMVWLKQSRSCPLELPPPPEVVPAWKMIRPRKPKVIPADLLNEKGSMKDIDKPIQSLEMASPFIGSQFWTQEQEKLEMEKMAAKVGIDEEGEDLDMEPSPVATPPQPASQPQVPPSPPSVIPEPKQSANVQLSVPKLEPKSLVTEKKPALRQDSASKSDSQVSNQKSNIGMSKFNFSFFLNFILKFQNFSFLFS